MTKLTTKVQQTVEEARILIVGTALLIGFDYRGTFESAFNELPKVTQDLKLLSLGLLFAALALLLWPTAFHNLVEDGNDTRRMLRFSNWVMDVALLPFALALGLEVYVPVQRVYGQPTGIAGGALATLVALYFWYGLEYLSRNGKGSDPMEEQRKAAAEREEEAQGTPISKKLDHALEEVRSVLPGVQALLGFQLAAMLVEGFDKLPASSKHVHLASLGFNALAIVLLMAPAAYHRIVCEGEDTESMHRFASRMILAAMVPLALGLAGDFFVVVRKITDSATLAGVAALVVLVVFYGCWFGYTALRRSEEPAGAAAEETGSPLASAA